MMAAYKNILTISIYSIFIVYFEIGKCAFFEEDMNATFDLSMNETEIEPTPIPNTSATPANSHPDGGRKGHPRYIAWIFFAILIIAAMIVIGSVIIYKCQGKKPNDKHNYTEFVDEKSFTITKDKKVQPNTEYISFTSFDSQVESSNSCKN